MSSPSRPFPLFGLSLLLALPTLAPAHAQDEVRDDFDVPRNFASEGTVGSIWDGFLVNAGTAATQDTVMGVADASVTSPGVLVLASTFSDWEHANDDGLLLFRNVNGDFDAIVEVQAGTSEVYNDLGLMARVATSGTDDEAAGDGEDWIAVRYFMASFNAIRSVDDGVTTNLNSSGLQPWLRLSRRGTEFFLSRRASAGDPWEPLAGSPIERPDLAGLPLQVGLWHATFSANEGLGVFDQFVLQQPFFSDGFETGDVGAWN